MAFGWVVLWVARWGFMRAVGWPAGNLDGWEFGCEEGISDGRTVGWRLS